MGLRAWFKPRPAAEAGRRLYGLAVAQARRPAFYEGLGVADTPLGRFELYSLHVVLAILRLKGRDARLSGASQALFDAYLEGLDIALREMGVGDLSMGKKMKKLGRAAYGRTASWEHALRALPERGDIEALVRRTIYDNDPAADPAPLAAYAARTWAHLLGQADEALARGEMTWPTP